jgi:hypothetical protein
MRPAIFAVILLLFETICAVFDNICASAHPTLVSFLDHNAYSTITYFSSTTDVVYYNNGVWSVYFDGTARGLTAGNLDVDAFDLP